MIVCRSISKANQAILLSCILLRNSFTGGQSDIYIDKIHTREQDYISCNQVSTFPESASRQKKRQKRIRGQNNVIDIPFAHSSISSPLLSFQFKAEPPTRTFLDQTTAFSPLRLIVPPDSLLIQKEVRILAHILYLMDVLVGIANVCTCLWNMRTNEITFPLRPHTIVYRHTHTHTHTCVFTYRTHIPVSVPRCFTCISLLLIVWNRSIRLTSQSFSPCEC